MMPRVVHSLVLLLAIGIAYGAPARPLHQPPEPLDVTPQVPVYVTTPTGLKYIDQRVGTGKVAKNGDTVETHYAGTLSNGKKFDASYDRGMPFPLLVGAGQVIKGWDEGLVGMKEGGKRKLIIPPELGYGARGVGDVIPPNSTLIFEVELLKVK